MFDASDFFQRVLIFNASIFSTSQMCISLPMNRLTADLLLEIRTFLDPESFYQCILACHVATDSVDTRDAKLLMKSGRPMIREWLFKYIDFPLQRSTLVELKGINES